MSVSADAVSELPLSADAPVSAKGKPPKSRTITATADAVEQPEAR